MQYKNLNMSEIYGEYCETLNEVASEQVQKNYKIYNRAFDEYISAISEDSFSKGFRYALQLSGKEVMAHD